ncbi:MAG TPA: tripartite tricarboxylate transporter TctB family protein, partial [Casimicrobium sp.]|nr:tripartite tricarboxylate transporter TctB family protein [Casimicrobium sp.]
MSEPEETSAVSTRTLEIIVALVLLALAVLIMWDSRRMGAGWGASGPESGYFPFYIGLMMAIASVVNLIKGWRMSREKSFVSSQALRLVGAMFFPALAFVFAMQWLGLYVSGAILIAVFMRWQGKFSYPICAAV